MATSTISGINVSSLTDGTLNLLVNLLDSNENITTTVADNIIKDTTAPTIIKLGNNSTDVTIATGSTATLIFNEILTSESKNTVNKVEENKKTDSDSLLCLNVNYDEYKETCFNGYQFRNVITRNPDNCILTQEQIKLSERPCVMNKSIKQETKKASSEDKEKNNQIILREKSLLKKIDKKLTERLIGYILLQVESQGEAWYLDPISKSKYFLGRPKDAFDIMKKLDLGINNQTFNSFKNNKAPIKLAGRILIKTEDKGKAYYINPIDLKLYYLGRPSDAFGVMKKLGLGINNENLRKIEINSN